MPFSKSLQTKTYSQEDVQQILNLAISQDAHNSEFSRTQLIEIAAEMEIAPETLQKAESLWQQQKGALEERQLFDRYRKARLKRHVGRYLIVSVGLVLLNGLTSFSTLWSMYIILIWGLKLGLTAWNVLHTQGDTYEKAFRRWNRWRLIQKRIETYTRRLFPG